MAHTASLTASRSEQTTINLKSPITFRVELPGRTVAFSVRTFAGERRTHVGVHPEPRDRVCYRVDEIVLEPNTDWFKLTVPTTVIVQWAHVVSEQPHELPRDLAV